MEHQNIYDEFMDEECIALCDALNELPGVETFESCCGHLNRPYMVFFRSVNPYSLAVIARSFDRRYCPTIMEWRIELETIDSNSDPQCVYCIHSIAKFPNRESMIDDVRVAIRELKYWSGDNFKEYFKYDKYVEKPE